MNVEWLLNNTSVSKGSNIPHHMNRARHFMENSVMTRLGDILRSWGPADPGPQKILKQDLEYHKTENWTD